MVGMRAIVAKLRQGRVVVPVFFVLIVFVLLVGCTTTGSRNDGTADSVAKTQHAGESGATSSSPPSEAWSEEVAPEPRSAGASSSQGLDPYAGQGPTSSSGLLQFERRQIIRNAKLLIEVDHLANSIQSATQSANLVGGHVTRLQATYARERGSVPPIGGDIRGEPQRAWLTLRVPAAEFDASLVRLRSLGEPITDEIYTNDVTEHVLDYEARIRNLTVQEEQLQRLLSDTKDMGQIIQIYDRLTGVRSEIDQLQGRLNVLKEDVAYSTIELTLTQSAVISGKALNRDAPVSVRAWHNLLLSLNAMFGGVLEGVVWFGGALPYLLLVVLFGWASWVGWNRWGRKR